MLAHGIRQLVFSSTAAVYGQPKDIPIKETHPLHPTNAYGESKLMVERMLDWFHRAHGLRYACLRYFNAAGSSAERGEDHRPESHLIPCTLKVALGQSDHVSHLRSRLRHSRWHLLARLYSCPRPSPGPSVGIGSAGPACEAGLQPRQRARLQCSSGYRDGSPRNGSPDSGNGDEEATRGPEHLGCLLAKVSARIEVEARISGTGGDHCECMGVAPAPSLRLYRLRGQSNGFPGLGRFLSRETIRMNDLGEDLQTIHYAWARTVEVGRAVDSIYPTRLHGGELVHWLWEGCAS